MLGLARNDFAIELLQSKAVEAAKQDCCTRPGNRLLTIAKKECRVESGHLKTEATLAKTNSW